MLKRSSLKLLVVGFTSACGLVVEIVAGRMIAPYLGMSLYTWTAIISVVLAGFSVGHWIGGRLSERPAERALRFVAWSLLLAAATTGASLIVVRTVVPSILAQGWSAVPTVLTATFLLFFLPSFFVGVPSPVLTKLAVDEAPPTQYGRVIGYFFAVGAIGSIAGTLLAGFVFISWLGTTMTLLLVALLYAALGFALLLFGSGGRLTGLMTSGLVGIVGTVGLGYVGREVQAFRDPCLIGSSYYCIRIVDVSREYGTPARLMVLDHLGHGVNLKSAPRKLVSPYVELHDTLARIHSGRSSPFHVFFIGGGAYTLPRAWASARSDAKIIVSEIDPEVTRLARAKLWFEHSPRVITVTADARVALKAQPVDHFDVIVGDAFHDIVIPAHLITEEFFTLVASRLKSDGLYVMNVVDARRHPRLALSIYRTMQMSMANVEVWVTNEAGGRATFVLAAVPKATPYRRIASQNSPGVSFLRLSEKRLAELSDRVHPIRLSDDFAPVDRLIGIE